MGLSARYKRRPIRTKSGFWMKTNNKLQYYVTSLYTSCSDKASYKFCWEFR